jgi:hypothetical protein
MYLLRIKREEAMGINRIYFIILLLSIFIFSGACTPTTRVSQSQQTWNEYKGKDVKKVTRGKRYRDRR